MGGLLTYVAFLGGLVGRPVVAVGRVLVQGDLGVECMHLAGRLEDERVDLSQVRVALGVGPVELQQDVDGAVGGLGVQLRFGDPRACRRLVESVDRVDPDLGDGVGVVDRHGLDLDATLGGEHAQVLLGRTIQGEGRVVLLGDVRGDLDPHDLDRVTLDVHPDDVGGVLAHLVGVVGQLDPARLAATADLDLRLDHDRVLPDAVGRCNGVLDRRDRFALRHRNVEGSEELLSLVLEEVHPRVPSCSANGPSNCAGAPSEAARSVVPHPAGDTKRVTHTFPFGASA